MLTSSIIRNQLDKDLKSTKIFMLFGFVLIFLTIIFIPIIEAHGSSRSSSTGVISTRIISYGIVIPYFIYYYVYNPIIDIMKAYRFLVEIECGLTGCTGISYDEKVIHSSSSNKEEIIVIAGVKYSCIIYNSDNKDFYFPIAIIKKGRKMD